MGIADNLFAAVLRYLFVIPLTSNPSTVLPAHFSWEQTVLSGFLAQLYYLLKQCIVARTGYLQHYCFRLVIGLTYPYYNNSSIIIVQYSFVHSGQVECIVLQCLLFFSTAVSLHCPTSPLQNHNCLFVFLFGYFFICSFVSLFACLFVCLFFRLLILFICLFVYLFICLFVYLFVCFLFVSCLFLVCFLFVSCLFLVCFLFVLVCFLFVSCLFLVCSFLSPPAGPIFCLVH